MKRPFFKKQYDIAIALFFAMVSIIVYWGWRPGGDVGLNVLLGLALGLVGYSSLRLERTILKS